MLKTMESMEATLKFLTKRSASRFIPERFDVENARMETLVEQGKIDKTKLV